MRYFIFVQPSGFDKEAVRPEWIIMKEEDIIACRKAIYKEIFPDMEYSDQEALDDFIAVHWAREVPPEAVKILFPNG